MRGEPSSALSSSKPPEFPTTNNEFRHASSHLSYAINNMKVITTTPLDTKTTAPHVHHSPTTAIPPSSTEDEAKIKFISALEKGVDKLLSRGHGRDRISEELLNEIANGCSPNENEIFQTMESLGISLEDATKVMTVSTAFRNAQTSATATQGDGGSSLTSTSAIGAIDELTSRLNLADLLRGGGSRSRSPSPDGSIYGTPTSNIQISELTRNESVDSLQSRMAKNGQRLTTKISNKSQQQQQARGRKRALADKTAEKRDSNNVMIGEQSKQKQSASSAAAATSASDLDMKNKMLNAKLSKAEGNHKKPSSASRAKSPEGGLGVARGKRASAVAPREGSPKRARTRSETEESIPDILR